MPLAARPSRSPSTVRNGAAPAGRDPAPVSRRLAMSGVSLAAGAEGEEACTQRVLRTAQPQAPTHAAPLPHASPPPHAREAPLAATWGAETPMVDGALPLPGLLGRDHELDFPRKHEGSIARDYDARPEGQGDWRLPPDSAAAPNDEVSSLLPPRPRQLSAAQGAVAGEAVPATGHGIAGVASPFESLQDYSRSSSPAGLAGYGGSGCGVAARPVQHTSLGEWAAALDAAGSHGQSRVSSGNLGEWAAALDSGEALGMPVGGRAAREVPLTSRRRRVASPSVALDETPVHFHEPRRRGAASGTRRQDSLDTRSSSERLERLLATAERRAAVETGRAPFGPRRPLSAGQR